MTGTTIDLLATAMGDWHGCTNNGKGGHLPPCQNCRDRAHVCATALDALAEPPAPPRHAAGGPLESERLADVARWRADAEHHMGPDA